MPPLQALAALHGFWLMMVALPLVVVLRHAQPGPLRRIGLTITSLAVLALLLWLGIDVAGWLGEKPGENQPYVVHRVLFTLVTLVDAPLLQLLAAGLVCWYVGSMRTRNAADSARSAENRD